MTVPTDPVDDLITALVSENEEQAIQAAHALGTRKGERAFHALLRLLDTTVSPALRNAAATGLRELDDPRAVPTLTHRIANLLPTGDVGTLIWALEPLDARSAVVVLTRAACTGNYERLMMATLVLDAFQGPPPPELTRRAIRHLRRCLRTERYRRWQRSMLVAILARLREFLQASSV